MSVAAVAIAAPVGALVGLSAGWLSVMLERVERLEDEDREDSETYQREVEEATAAARGRGDPPPVADPWPRQRFGWTWLERYLAPLLGAAGFSAFAVHEAVATGLFIHCLWLALFVQVVVFDLKHRLILNRVTYPAVVVALALAAWSPGLTVWRSLAGAVVIGLFFLLQNIVSRGSIGLGDAKLGAVLGAVCGLSLDLNHIGAVYAVIYAVFLGGGMSLMLLVLRIRGLKDPIPYGPFLCVGASVILFFGP
jgi:prepilin signal peptidase PulO-like enzyme (type II secretory pathway)